MDVSLPSPNGGDQQRPPPSERDSSMSAKNTNAQALPASMPSEEKAPQEDSVRRNAAPAPTRPDVPPLFCQAVVVRMGELFGEFGIDFSGNVVETRHIAFWQLSIRTTHDIVDNGDEEDASGGEVSSPSPPEAPAGGDSSSNDAAAAAAASAANNHDMVFNGVLEADKFSKLVKLPPGKRFAVKVRYFTPDDARFAIGTTSVHDSDSNASARVAERRHTGSSEGSVAALASSHHQEVEIAGSLQHFERGVWSAWSPTVLTASFHPVVARIDDIGEETIRVSWARAGERLLTGLVPELNKAATQHVADISKFELAVVREKGEVVEYSQVFDYTSRSVVVHNLLPGTAYTLRMRYETLLGTLINWVEVAKFFTEAALEVELVSRGEDVFSVGWKRGKLSREGDQYIGYALPQTEVHLYEVHVDGDNYSGTPIELSSSTLLYRATALFPGSNYYVYVRGLTREGQWGGRSNVLTVRTADRPTVSLLFAGENFLSFSWSRDVQEPCESKIEYRVDGISSTFHTEGELLLLGESEDEKAKTRQLNIEGLRCGQEYAVEIRSYLDHEWGLWTETESYATQLKVSIGFLERGEDFFTVAWPQSAAQRSKRTAALTTQIDSPTTDAPADTTLPTRSLSAPEKMEKYNIVVVRLDGRTHARTPVLDEVVVPRKGQPGFRVSNVLPDTLYEVKCRAWQNSDVSSVCGWGEFSPPVRVRTLPCVVLHAWDVGEDFVHIVWRRDLKEDAELQFNEMTDTDLNSESGSALETASVPAKTSAWNDVKYEVVVGCLDTQEDEVLHRQVTETTYMIKHLRPASTYIISVRACDAREQWGLWSKVKVRTLASVVTSIHEIGEDYVRLMWQRLILSQPRSQASTSSTSARTTTTQQSQRQHEGDDTIATADALVSRYNVLVFSKETKTAGVVADEESGYPEGGNAVVSTRITVSSEHTSLLMTDLLPNLEYVAVVRASTVSGKWGLWSSPVRFRTNTQFSVPLQQLSMGENYASFVWHRELPIVTDTSIQLGDMTVTAQQLRIRGVDNTSYSQDYQLEANVRELKVYNLSPANAYTVQIRVCGKTGRWGLWSAPVYVLTRGTVLTRTVEVAEDYATIAWERTKVPNPNHYSIGRAVVTAYHLRVYNLAGTHKEAFLTDADCPYRISGLTPDTYYCVELKANYNDEEWGQWCTPMWCLTMPPMRIQAQMISEEFCRLSITRVSQPKRLPEDDGNPMSEDKIVAFGQLRPHLMLCVTAPIVTRMPHTSSASTAAAQQPNSALPPDAANHRLIYQTEIISTSAETEHTVPNLKSNTVYYVSVRSKLPNGKWGMWCPSLIFATVPTTCVVFNDIGESFIGVEWRRHTQSIPPQVAAESVVLGLGTIGASRIRVREVGGVYQHLYSVESSLRTLRLDNLLPSTTYGISVQTYNDNFNWGVWSEESFARTVPGLKINIHHVAEDSLWVSWARLTDLKDMPDTGTALNVNIVAKAYELCISGAGHFRYTRELEDDALFFRGLQPDTLYTVHVRVRFTETEEWGLWSSQSFRTKPRMRVTFGSIGEHFAVVEWRRHLPQPTVGEMQTVTDTVAETPDIIQQYHFKVQRVGDPVAKLYSLSPTVSSFRLRDLQPSSEYRVWMCARGYEGVWGFWSEESRVRTLAKLELQVVDVGEDYVRVKWLRRAWDGEHMKATDDVEVREVDGAVSGYQVRVLDASGTVCSTQSLSFRETTCVLSGLKLHSLYSVEVAAKDTYNEWGLWSDAVRFITLQAVHTRLIRMGESFVDVSWCRKGLRKPSRQRTLEGPGNESGVGSPSVSLPADGDSAGSTESEDEDEEIPEDVIRQDDVVKEWHVRIQTVQATGEVVDFLEYNIEPAQSTMRVEELVPNRTYHIAVRARNRADEWGHWSRALVVTTYPILRARVGSVGETHVLISWEREPWKNLSPRLERKVCFPGLSSAHNFCVSIQPLPGETPFPDAHELSPDGSRSYETTQPSTRLSDLQPGTRYRIVVKEQLLGDDGLPLANTWGIACTPCIVKTIPPMGIVPAEIGEDYCLVEWGRVTRASVSTTNRSAPDGSGSSEYEVQVRRLMDDAATLYEGPFALDVTHTLPGESRQFLVEHLQHNTIYEVRVRAKNAGGHWGPWCRPTKFATQSRLQLSVVTVLETGGVIQWERPLPLWAHARAANANSTSRRTSMTLGAVDKRPWLEVLEPTTGGRTSVSFDGTISVAERSRSESVMKATFDSCSTTAELDRVEFGDNTIRTYELLVDGVTCAFHDVITLTKECLSTRVDGLRQNHIYTVTVRSMSEKEHWSRFSNKESFLTLMPLTAGTERLTEGTAVLRWNRAPSNAKAYAAVLKTKRKDAERLYDEKLRKELYAYKKKKQDDEEEGEADDAGDDEINVDDDELRTENNNRLRDEATRHLLPENVRTGGTDLVLCYRVQLRGVGLTENKILNACIQKVETIRWRGSKDTQRQQQQQQQHKSAAARRALTTEGHDGIADVTILSQSGSAAAGSVGSGAAAAGGGSSGAASNGWEAEGEEAVLLDLFVRPITTEITFDRLDADTTFSFRVCACESWEAEAHRSRRQSLASRRMSMMTKAASISGKEWQPWSVPCTFTTLPLIHLDHVGFGEQYIDLVWFRADAQKMRDAAADTQRYHQLRSILKEVLHNPQQLDAWGDTLSEEEYGNVITQIGELQRLEKKLGAMKEAYSAAAKEEAAAGAVGPSPASVLCHENTPLVGYQLRLVRENGTYEDTFIDSAHCTTHKLSDLSPNAFYVCLLCPLYAHERWGSWSRPLKIMTPNVIQLQIVYTGETFVDMEWRRLRNKKVPSAMDRDDTHFSTSYYRNHLILYRQAAAIQQEYEGTSDGATVIMEAAAEEQQNYEVHIVHDVDGVEKEETRPIRAANTFRLSDLLPDSKCTVSVRAWDPHGGWGMWCNPRSCTTLPAMYVTAENVGERGALISWDRQEANEAYGRDVRVLQLNVDIKYFYVRLQEMGVDHRTLLQHLFTNTAPVLEEDLERQLEDKDPKDGLLLQRFDGSVHELELRTLKPDTLYSLQVLAITTHELQGTWSGPRFILTVPPLVLTMDSLGENGAIFSWTRRSMQTADILAELHGDSDSLFTGSYQTASYELVVAEDDGSHAATEEEDEEGGGGVIVLQKLLNAQKTSLLVEGLTKNTSYIARVRAKEAVHQTNSVWSAPVMFKTKDTLRCFGSNVTETSFVLNWTRVPENEVIAPTPDATEAEEGDAAAATKENSRQEETAEEDGAPRKKRSHEENSSDVEAHPSHLSSLVIPDKENARHPGGSSTQNEEGPVEQHGEEDARLKELHTEDPLETEAAAPHQQEVGAEAMPVSSDGETHDTPGSGGEEDEEEADKALHDHEEEERLEGEAKEEKDEEDSEGEEEEEPTILSKFHLYICEVTRDAKTVALVDTTVERPEGGGPVGSRSFQVDHLRPNTLYVAMVRTTILTGDWGAWSEPIVLRTLKPLVLECGCVGEDFLLLRWDRSLLPAAEQEGVLITLNAAAESTEPPQPTSTLPPDVTRQAPSELKNFVIEPSKVSHTPDRSSLVSYALHYRKVSSTSTALPEGSAAGSGSYNAEEAVEECTLQVECADKDFYLLSSLTPNTCYAVDVCARYAPLSTGRLKKRKKEPHAPLLGGRSPSPDEPQEGPRSASIQVYTNNLLTTDVVDVAEDVLRFRWSALPTGRISGNDSNQFELVAHPEDSGVVVSPPFGKLLCYEVVVQKRGCNNSNNVDPTGPHKAASPGRKSITSEENGVLYRGFRGPHEEQFTIGQLDRTTRYRCAVRRWIQLPAWSPRAEAVLPQLPPTTEEQGAIRALLMQSHAIHGLWSWTTEATTLRDVECVIDAVSEDGFTVRWVRDTAGGSPDDEEDDEDKHDVAQVQVDELVPDSTEVAIGAGTYHLLEMVEKGERCFVVRHAKANTVYQVRVRCRREETWSPWSPLSFAQTSGNLAAIVARVLEDSAVITWKRQHQEEDPVMDGNLPVATGDQQSTAESFELEARGVGHTYEFKKIIMAVQDTFTIRDLKADSVYMVRLRAYDGAREEWSIWSTPVYFATLKPLIVVVKPVAEMGAHVEWHRDQQHSEDYMDRTHGLPVVLFEPNISAYHLCIFDGATTPSEAVVEKQLHRDMSSFDVQGLEASKSYVAIVRACDAYAEWGQWSEEAVFDTLDQLTLEVPFQGEDYVVLSWTIRTDIGFIPVHYTLLQKCGTETTQTEIAESDCEEIPGTSRRDSVAHRQLGYRVDGLRPGSDHVMSLQAKYGALGWGMWTTPIVCHTLNSIGLSVTLQQTKARIYISEVPLSGSSGGASSPSVRANDKPTVLKYELRGCLLKDTARVFFSRNRAKSTDRSAKRDPTLILFSQSFDVSGSVSPNKEIRYVLDGLAIDTEYTIGARAMDAGGEWGGWTKQTVTTPPLPPSHVHLHRANNQYCSLQWAPSGEMGAYKYWVEQLYSTNEGGAVASRRSFAFASPVLAEWRFVELVTEPVCGIRLAGGVARLRCRVRCARIGEDTPYSDYSEVVSVTPGYPPEPLTGVTVTSLSRFMATIEWDAPQHSTDGRGGGMVYHIYLSRSGLSEDVLNLNDHNASLFVKLQDESHSMAVLRDLTPSTVYCVLIIAENENGLSFHNPRIRFETRPSSDVMTTFYEEGMAPLGVLVEPELAGEGSIGGGSSSPQRHGTTVTVSDRVTANASGVAIPSPPSKPAPPSRFLGTRRSLGLGDKGAKTVPSRRGTARDSSPLISAVSASSTASSSQRMSRERTPDTTLEAGALNAMFSPFNTTGSITTTHRVSVSNSRRTSGGMQRPLELGGGSSPAGATSNSSRKKSRK